MIGIAGLVLGMLPKLIGFGTGIFEEKANKAKRAEDNAHELAMMRLQFDNSASIEAQRSQAVLTQSLVQANAQQQTTNYKEAGKTLRMADQWVINLSAVIRPIVTLVFVGMFVYLALAFGLDTTNTLSSTIITTLLGLLELVVCFWFGQRSINALTRK